MPTISTHGGLSEGGRSLWVSVSESHELDAIQEVQLLEACRAKDRLDKLDDLLRGEADLWMRLTHRVNTDDYELHIDKALAQANTTANMLKQLLAALRLPDEVTGKRPVRRPARGAYKTKSGSAKDRLRAV